MIPQLFSRPKSFAAAAALLLALAVPARAQGLKIGVLDFKQVTERSTAIQAMVKSAESPLAAKKSSIDSKTSDYKERKDKLDSRRSVLSEDQIKAEEQALDKIKTDIQDMQYEVNKQYDRMDQEVMQPAVERIMAIVQEIAKREGYDLVVPSEVALYKTDKIDLTPLVIQALDKEGAKPSSPAMPPSKDAAPAKSSDKSAPKSDAKAPAKGSPSKSGADSGK